MLVRRSSLLFIFFLVLLAFLQYRLWFESGGILDMMRLKKQVALSTEENEKLKKNNQLLLLEIQHLQQNTDAIESRARHDLGMVKKGETFYQVVQ